MGRLPLSDFFVQWKGRKFTIGLFSVKLTSEKAVKFPYSLAIPDIANVS